MDYTRKRTSQPQSPLNPNPSPTFFSVPHTQMYHHHHHPPPLPQPQHSFSTLSFQFAYQPHTTNPNSSPNPFLSFPQPVLTSDLTSQPALHPPGTDPFAYSGSYPLTHVGFGAQTQYSEDPNAASQNWVFKQADPVGYEAAINPLHDASIVSNSSNSLWNNYWTNQTLANEATNVTPMQTQVVRSMRCEVCKIDCTSKEVYEKHVSGKKHKRNLQVQNSPTTAMLLRSSNVISNINLPSQMISTGGQVISVASGVAAGEELETRRQKLLNGGAAFESVRVCTICNVACNSQEVYNKHLAGKKHAAQAGLVALGEVGSYFAAIRHHNNNFWNKNSKKSKVVQSAWCEVCKINCNSNEVYITHLSGKKHQKNLEKLSKSKNDASAPASNAPPASTNPIIGPPENPEANKGNSIDLPNSLKKDAQSQAPEEGLETKIRKVLEGGAVVNAVRTCTVCNVVCNSQTVFNAHLTGQKHSAMVKKQAEAGMEWQSQAPN